jgi:hypothetical protein
MKRLLIALLFPACTIAHDAADSTFALACDWRPPLPMAEQPIEGLCLKGLRNSGNVTLFAWSNSYRPNACDVVDNECVIVQPGEVAYYSQPTWFDGNVDYTITIGPCEEMKSCP